jgi:hypothetical protein
MPILTGAIEPDGALVGALFGWSETAVRKARASLRPIPQGVSARPLGYCAEVTCLDTSLIHSLGMAPQGPQALFRVGPAECRTCWHESCVSGSIARGPRWSHPSLTKGDAQKRHQPSVGETCGACLEYRHQATRPNPRHS